MIIKPINRQLIQYKLNPDFAIETDKKYDWVIGTTYKIVKGEVLPFGLILDWNILHKVKNSDEKVIEYDSRFYMEFSVEIEAKDRKDLAVYLNETIEETQNLIREESPELLTLLKPIKLHYEGLAHNCLWEIIQFGCYNEN